MESIKREISTMYVDEAMAALAKLKKSRDSLAQRIESRGYPIEITFPEHRFVFDKPEDVDQVIEWLEIELPLAEERRRLWRENMRLEQLAGPEISVQADPKHLSQLKACVVSMLVNREKTLEQMKDYPMIVSVAGFEFCIADEIDFDRLYRWICREAERLERDLHHEAYETICETTSEEPRERRSFLSRLFGRSDRYNQRSL